MKLVTFTYTYDAYGNRTQADDPGLGLWRMTYDANGNLLTQTDAKGQVTSFTYDNLNRPTLKTVTGEPNTVMIYDQPIVDGGVTYATKGRLTWIEKGQPGDADYHRIRYGYSPQGGVGYEQHTFSGGRDFLLNREFRADGSVARMRLPDDPGVNQSSWTAFFEHDASSRLEGFPGYITDITYDQGTDEFTLTWTSKPNRTYGLYYSTDLQDWGADIDDSIPTAGEATTFGPFPNPEPGSERVYFRIEEAQ